MDAREVVPRSGGTSGAIRITRRAFLKIGGAGLVGAALLGNAGCGVFQQGDQQSAGGGADRSTLRINLQADIPDLNSTTTIDVISFGVLNNLMEGLYRLDENEQPLPAQAQGVEVSADKLTYTFTLRDGIKWSDGNPVTSQDFKYAWLRAIDPKNAGQYSFIIADYIKGGTEFFTGEGTAADVAIETPDDKTLEVTLANPTPYFLGLTAFVTYLPQHQEFTQARGEDYARNPDGLLYNGPYTLTEFDPANGATFVKNEDYWDKDNVSIQTIDARIVKDVATAVNLYEAGELDVTPIAGEFVDQYQDSPAFNAQVIFATTYLIFNYKEEVLQNENVRRALILGYDRDALADKILNDGSIGAEGYVPPEMDAGGPGDEAFRDVASASLESYNPRQARKLYQQGVEELGREPTLELLGDDTSVTRDVLTFLKSQFEENLGAKVEVNLQPFDQKLELESSGNFQVSTSGWAGDYNDPMSFLDLWTTNSPFNAAGFSNERYDQLIKDAKTEADLTNRQDMLVEAEKILLQEQAAIGPSHHLGIARLVRPSVKNLVFHPYGSNFEFKYASIE